MKRVCILVLFLLVNLGLGEIYAQQGMSLGGVYQKFYDLKPDTLFPYSTANQHPNLWGFKGRFNQGISFKTTVNGSLTYAFAPVSLPKMGYDSTRYKTTQIELEVNLNRYLLGAYNDLGGLYVFTGLSAGYTSIKWVALEGYIPKSDLVTFQDKTSLYANLNVGLGAEAWVGAFYLFGEAKGTYNLDKFVDFRTTGSMHLQHYWNTTVGIRIPFGGDRRGK